MYENGILHRDISPGNVFLFDKRYGHVMSDGQQGFLADLELAKVPLLKVITITKPVSTPRHDESGAAIIKVPPSAGPAMTVCLSSFEFLIFMGYSCSS